MISTLEHHKRGYVSGGNSIQTDGHDDKRVESTSRKAVDGDQSNETGGDKYKGTNGKEITGQKGDKVNIWTSYTANSKTCLFCMVQYI